MLWYEAVEFCNQLSTAAGLHPAYTIEKGTKAPNIQIDDKKDALKWRGTVAR